MKLLTGKLFQGFDERISGPMDSRFKMSVGNAIRNMVEKEREPAAVGSTCRPKCCLPQRRPAWPIRGGAMMDYGRREGHPGTSGGSFTGGWATSARRFSTCVLPAERRSCWSVALVFRQPRKVDHQWRGSAGQGKAGEGSTPPPSGIRGCFGGSRRRWRAEEATVGEETGGDGGEAEGGGGVMV